jgi:hypothetical protein
MTTSNNPEKQNSQKKRYLMSGIVIVGLLVGGLILLFQRISQAPSSSPSSDPTIQINLPTVEYPTIPASAPAFTVPIHNIGSSGITGTATFKDIAGTVAILLHFDGLPEEEESEESIMPAEIRYGTCTDPESLAYPLTAPDAGQSETDLSINLQQFNMQKPMAVVLYRSTQDRSVIACGDVQ